MKRLLYKPKKPVNFGRFGKIKGGSVIAVTELEYGFLKNDSRFKLAKGEEENDWPEEASEDVLPYATGNVDLRQFPWQSEKLPNVLTARTNKVRLLKIASAIEEVGGDIQVNPSESRDLIADRIVVAYKTAGWHLLDEDKREALPHVRDVEPISTEQPETETATRKRTR